MAMTFEEAVTLAVQEEVDIITRKFAFTLAELVGRGAVTFTEAVTLFAQGMKLSEDEASELISSVMS